MLISSDVSAKRQSSFQQRAEGPIPGPTSDIAKGQSLPQRPIPGPGGVFSRRPASLETQHHPHLSCGGIPLSSGFSGFPEDSAASAANPLSFPKMMPQAVTATPGPDPVFRTAERPSGRLGITMNVSPTPAPEGAGLCLSNTDAGPQLETPLEWAIRKDAAETSAEKALRKKHRVMSREDHILMLEGQEAQKDQTWDQFYRAIRRGRQLYAEYRAIDPKHPRLKALEHCCFACRMYAGSRLDENGERSATIGYAEGEIAWMGTHKCGAGRFCVLCGAQIAAKNQENVETGLRNGIAKGMSTLMLTYTNPHYATQSALESVENLTLAYTLAGKGGDMTRFRKKYGVVGYIVRQEETYGRNGWHPHLHTIVFFDHVLSEEEIAEVTEKFKQKWQAACYKIGIIPPHRTKAFEKHGFLAEPTLNIKQVADYLAKVGWKNSSAEFKVHAKESILESSGKRIKGAAFELSARDAKAPRMAEGRTPWDILEGFANGDPRDTELWLDYIEAFAGKPMVRWSPRLKAELEIKDKDEEDQVKADEEDGLCHIYRVSADHYADGVARNGLWRPILKAVDKRDFVTLQEIANRYDIDFKKASKKGSSYPEICCQATLTVNKDEERRERRRAAEKLRREEAARLKARQEAKERARLKVEREYSVSLLSEDDRGRLAATQRANRLDKRQARKDVRRKRRDLQKE